MEKSNVDVREDVQERNRDAATEGTTSWYYLVGTSHVARDAERTIMEAYHTFHPSVVAVELDRARLSHLLSNQKGNVSWRLARQIGVKGYLFARIAGWLQQKIGKRVNLTPGADMLAAVRLAQREGLQLLLIDQELYLTLRRLNRALGWPEARQLLKDLFRRERVSFDVAQIPSDQLVRQLLTLFKKNYPRPYAVLVEERNKVMARRLHHFHHHAPDEKVLVVVGAGHKEGLQQLLSADKDGLPQENRGR